MQTRIGRIVRSNSHIDYVARVIDALDADQTPSPDDYGFGQFVSIPADATEIIGVIYNSELVNPEYGSFGPRLSSARELAVLSPDYLNEQGQLVGILLLGWFENDAVDGLNTNSGKRATQGVPRRIIPVNQDVYALSIDEVASFHKGPDGRASLNYFSQVMENAGTFGPPLIETMIAQVEPGLDKEDMQRICVLRQALVWQRTVGRLRL
jgi:hypothetical protein